jgi:hypothetical protein
MNKKILMKVLLLAVTLVVIVYSKVWLSDHAENLALSRDIGNMGTRF